MIIPSSEKIDRSIDSMAGSRTSVRYLLKTRLSDAPAHVIWAVLRVRRQRVAIMFVASTLHLATTRTYARPSFDDRHVRSDNQLRRTRRPTMSGIPGPRHAAYSMVRSLQPDPSFVTQGPAPRFYSTLVPSVFHRHVSSETRVSGVNEFSFVRLELFGLTSWLLYLHILWI